MKRVIYLLLFTAAMIPASVFAQSAAMDTVTVPGLFATISTANPNGVEGTLNDSISVVEHADSVNHTNNLSNTVFKLLANDQYVLTGTINIPAGETLNVVGPEPGNTQAGSLPMILWTSTGNVTENFNFDCFGNIYLKNIWLLYATTNNQAEGTQVGSALEIEDDSLADLSGVGEHGTFDDVIFDYCPVASNGGGAVTVTAKDFKGTFTNCFFRNDIDTHLRYYGRAVSFPYNSTGWQTDSVSFTNCTFANMGYVLMQEGAEYSNNVWFNHCTFENIMMYPLESGWWKNLVVANCVFDNPWMFGEYAAEDTAGGTSGAFSIDSVSTFGFSVPFTDQQRHILFVNSSYCYEPWLLNYMTNNPYSQGLISNRLNDEVPQPDTEIIASTMHFFTDTLSTGGKAFPTMNLANVRRYDGVNPDFITPLTNVDSAEAYLYDHWSADINADWAFDPDSDLNQIWPLPGNLAYTNDTLMHAGTDGLPLGDLYHWWNGSNGTTDYYAQWKAQESSENTLLANAEMTGDMTGIVTAVAPQPGSSLPSTFKLSQNYPNPFNPTTQIDYSVAKRAMVTLTVYNVLGQKVATLVSGVQQPGNYSATFNGNDLASGVYFYRLQAGSVSITRKLVLLK